MKNKSLVKFIDIVDAYLIINIFIFILFIKAISSLLEFFTYGIFKKEILTKRSKLGFDIQIKM